MTYIQKTCVIGLFIVLMLVYPTEAILTDPVLCYVLDGFLLIYCIVVTALFVNVKFCPSPTKPEAQESDHIYQDLLRRGGNDGPQPAIILQGRAQIRKKTKRDASSHSSMDAYETLANSVSQTPR